MLENVILTFQTFQGCAFVQFTQRKSAEKAAEGTFNKLLIKGNKITIRWIFCQKISGADLVFNFLSQVGQVARQDCRSRRHRSWPGELDTLSEVHLWCQFNSGAISHHHQPHPLITLETSGSPCWHSRR